MRVPYKNVQTALQNRVCSTSNRCKVVQAITSLIRPVLWSKLIAGSQHFIELE
jgi:hypothetical protein